MHDEPQPKHSPRWQGLTHTGKTNDAGRAIPGDPIIINCHSHTEVGLCADCATDLARVLADVPRLLDDLDIAIAGETRFVEHGVRAGRDGETASRRHPAIAAQNRLTLALLGDGTTAHPGVRDWFNNYGPASYARQLASKLLELAHEPRMPNLARDLSQAASRAHHVIDIPKDMTYYGRCPDCGRDIVQERIRTIVENGVRTVAPDAPPVACRFTSCGYAAPLDLHQKKLLEAGEDRWLTVGELVSAITSGGEIVTRHQIRHWIDKEGLPREIRVRPEWVNGELKSHEVATYRLGDVREMAQRADQKRQRTEA